MALTATLYVDNDPAERRLSPRRSVGAETTVRRSGTACDAILHDLSDTGASVETTVPLAPGATVTIGLPGVGRVAATVMTTTGSRAGCRFVEPLSFDALRQAFASESVIVGAFGGASATIVDEPDVGKYPGYVRVGLPVAGAVGGWLLIFQAIHAAFT